MQQETQYIRKREFLTCTKATILYVKVFDPSEHGRIASVLRATGGTRSHGRQSTVELGGNSLCIQRYLVTTITPFGCENSGNVQQAGLPIARLRTHIRPRRTVGQDQVSSGSWLAIRCALSWPSSHPKKCRSTSGRCSRSTNILTKLSFRTATIRESEKVVLAITWHQWQVEYPIERKISLFSLLASSKASMPHGCQSIRSPSCCSR